MPRLGEGCLRGPPPASSRCRRSRLWCWRFRGARRRRGRCGHGHGRSRRTAGGLRGCGGCTSAQPESGEGESRDGRGCARGP
ncbi:hypothetical protein ACFPRL_33430 [Pseudoclavibacter helvolus]